jgi:SAM-dependent methyltransferase
MHIDEIIPGGLGDLALAGAAASHAAEHRPRPDRSAPPSMATDPFGDEGADGDGTFDHGRRSRFNAWFFGAFDRYIAHISRRHKDAAFAGIDPGESGTVVEIGAGVGANFDHIPSGARLMAVEPSVAMHETLRARAIQRGIDLELVGGTAERLPLADESVEEIICSLVLCTVEDPAATLAEVCRVLRPGGRFRFVEHVAAPWWSPRRWAQHGVRRPWAWIFEGCDLCRDTAATITAAGFDEICLTRGRFRRSLFFPVNTVVSGWAVR